jgi:hypothetical protein
VAIMRTCPGARRPGNIYYAGAWQVKDVR